MGHFWGLLENRRENQTFILLTLHGWYFRIIQVIKCHEINRIRKSYFSTPNEIMELGKDHQRCQYYYMKDYIEIKSDALGLTTLEPTHLPLE